MRQLYFLPIFFLLVLPACTSSKSDSFGSTALTASQLFPFGRVLRDENNDIELISSAAHVGFTFTGTECQVHAYIKNSVGHNYLQYELDGQYQKRIKVTGTNNQPVLIKATTDGQHTVWLYKATEAHTGPVFIEKITGENLKAIERPKAPLIEFIGNSITCGAAADPSEVPCGTGEYHDQHNAYLAYGPRVARTLNVNFLISSVSGIGIYRNWNSDGPTMPQVFDEADFSNEGKRLWDFRTYQPDIVSIALGTNDFSNGDGTRPRLPFDSAVFVDNYINFVQHVKSKYPKTQIALLSSPMIKSDRRTTLQNCLTAVKQKIDDSSSSDKPIAVFFFKPMEAQGCTGHPNVEDHAVLAREVAPFFKGLLN
jgi:lysophospholipase L1-like esterase